MQVTTETKAKNGQAKPDTEPQPRGDPLLDPLQDPLQAESEGDGAALGDAPAEIARRGLSGEPAPLPHQGSLEKAFGVSLGGVRAHTDVRAQEAADRLGVPGFALGADIGLADTSIEIIAHELAHVIQQGAVGSATGKGGDLEAQASLAAAQAASGEQVLVPLSPAGGEQLQTWSINVPSVSDIGNAVASNIGSAVTSGVSNAVSNVGTFVSEAPASIGAAAGQAASNIGNFLSEAPANVGAAGGEIAHGIGNAASNAAQGASTLVRNVTPDNIEEFIEEFDPAELLQQLSTWARDDLVEFILRNWNHEVVPALVRHMPAAQLSEAMRRIWEGAPSDASIQSFVQLLVQTDTYVAVFQWTADQGVDRAFAIARATLTDHLLVPVLRAVKALAFRFFTDQWHPNTGLRAYVKGAFGVSVPAGPLKVKIGADGGMRVSFLHIGGASGPGIKIMAGYDMSSSYGAGVGVASVVDASVLAGPTGAESVGGTLWLDDLDANFWNVQIIDVLRAGDVGAIVNAIGFAVGDAVAAIQWTYTRQGGLEGTGQASVGTGKGSDDDEGGSAEDSDGGLGPPKLEAWVKLMAAAGLTITILSPTDSRGGKAFLRGSIDRSMSVGAMVSLFNCQQGAGKVDKLLAGVANAVLNLSASAGLNDSLGFELCWNLASYAEWEPSDFLAFNYIDFFYQQGADVQVSADSAGAKVGQALRFTSGSIGNAVSHLESGFDSPRDAFLALPFASIRFDGFVACDSHVVGILLGLFTDAELTEMLSPGARVIGSLKIQFDITKEMILDLIGDLWDDAKDLVEAVVHMDGPAVISALGDMLGDIGNFILAAIEYLEVDLETDTMRLPVGGSISYVDLSVGAGYAAFFYRKYWGAAEILPLFGGAQGPTELAKQVFGMPF